MKKQELNITIDPQCPDEIKANGIAWVEDACNWLLSQPRTTDAIQPRFSEVAITIKPCGFGRGVRDVRDGRGSLALDTGTDLKIDTGGKIVVIPTAQEIAFRGNAVFLLSQLFRPDGYYEDSFRQEEHTHYQLKFLDRLAESNRTARSLLDDYEEAEAARKEEERLAVYNAQFSTKYKQTQLARKLAREIHTPSWWWKKYPDAIVSQHESEATKPNQKPTPATSSPKPHYCEHESPGPLPPQPPVERPVAPISAQDQAALDVIKSQQEYMQSFANREKLEDN